MSLSFKICSNSLANPPQCLSPTPMFLGLSYYFGRIFHGFGIFCENRAKFRSQFLKFPQSKGFFLYKSDYQIINFPLSNHRSPLSAHIDVFLGQAYLLPSSVNFLDNAIRIGLTERQEPTRSVAAAIRIWSYRI